MPEPLVSKAKILGTFREAVQEVMDGNQDRNAADAAKKVNKAVRDAEALFRAKVERRAAKEGWAQETKAQVALLTRYCGCVVLIEGRNAVRPYEYMDFSRRVGELWERFADWMYQRYLPRQREDGSWPQEQNTPAYSTSMVLLSLTVPYR